MLEVCFKVRISSARFFAVRRIAVWAVVACLVALPVFSEEPKAATKTQNHLSKSAESGPRAQESPVVDKGQGPYLYDLKYQLEVEGQIHLLSASRYFRFQDLHLKAMARREGGYLKYELVGLVTGKHDLNYGIGEGPKRHQRYILLDRVPSKEEISRVNGRILLDEQKRIGSIQQATAAVGKEDEKEDEDSDTDSDGTFQGKKAFFNYFLWKEPYSGFSFYQTYYGAIPIVHDQVEVKPIIKEGGRKARPRFFETLEYSLLAIPPFVERSSRAYGPLEGSWQVSCLPILEGLVNLCKEVYGRKMTLLDTKAGEEEKVRYTSRWVPGTTIVRITGSFGKGTPTGIRVSGFKGEIWIESLRRDVLIETATGRILRDDLRMDFGIERNTKILRISGRTNRVEVTLADHCFLGDVEGDADIAHALETCNATQPGS